MEANIVTIPIDEYFELRQKAEMNMTMVREIAGFENRLNEFNRVLNDFSSRIYRIEMEIKK